MARTRKTPVTPAPTLRHAWLAGLGLIVIARREAASTGERVSATLTQLQRRAQAAVADGHSDLRARIELVRTQVAPVVAGLGRQVDARLAPVLGRFGLRTTPATRRTARTPAKAARRPARRTAPRMRRA